MTDSLVTVFLADRDASCPRCGYNLRATRDERCSECGARLELRVASEDLRLAPWLTALLATAIGFGFTLMVTLVTTGSMLAVGAGSSFAWGVASFFWGVTIVLGAMLAALTLRRRSFLKRPAFLQWSLAGAVIAVELPLVLIIVIACMS